MKVLVVMGTRPEAIKLAPVVAALRRRRIRTVVCATGQHRELLASALRPFGLRPDVDLRLMRPGQTPDQVARRAMAALAPLLRRVKPALVVVQGDTTTAAAAAVAAREAGIPVAHVEAGLRTFDRDDPFPEERNRVLIDSIASVLFPPTPAARANLRRERLGGRSIHVTGNTVVDALRALRPRRGRTNEVLVTLHRRELHGRPLARLCGALTRLAERHPAAVFVYPVHPNPAVDRVARRLLRHARVRLVRPLPYPELLALLARCLFVITDSGGIQEEAATLGKPLLIARRRTERPEILAAGAGLLVGLDPRRLEREASRLLGDAALRRRMGRGRRLFGDGRAAARVAAGVAHWLGRGPAPKDWRP
ncbi:MAG: UDP-N-acetylglucosamine 2-epimerase (non-hydrolyzing) [Elusimicrobiota bacterium]|nr:MAG: UDP-N-acetylglucosamine 2-epimerase (non-hydrolyzing) [Elusimicrobiota bacterium]